MEARLKSCPTVRLKDKTPVALIVVGQMNDLPGKFRRVGRKLRDPGDELLVSGSVQQGDKPPQRLSKSIQ
jgi:hypothetical protein